MLSRARYATAAAALARLPLPAAATAAAPSRAFGSGARVAARATGDSTVLPGATVRTAHVASRSLPSHVRGGAGLAAGFLRTRLATRTTVGAACLATARGVHTASSAYASATGAADDDYYGLLGVPRTATTDQIKTAYYAMAKKFHPDRNKEPGASERFAKINAAYDTLRDDKKRAAYDRYGKEGADYVAQGGGARGGGGMDDDFMSSFRRIFEQEDTPQQRVPRGNDIQVSMRLSFIEAVKGVEKEVAYETLARCAPCGGSGAKPGTTASRCTVCRGTGTVVHQNGIFQMQTVCTACGGAGEVIPHKCTACTGHGVVKKRKTLKVAVPAGVDTGVAIRCASEGEEAPRGGQPGNLFVRLRVDEHPVFERDGADIHVMAPLTIGQALLGGTVVVPSIDGDVEIAVAAGTQPDEKRVLRQRGVPKLRQGTRGHQYVHFKLVVPTTLTDTQRKLAEEFRAEEVKTIEPKSFIKNAAAKLGRLFSKASGTGST